LSSRKQHFSETVQVVTLGCKNRQLDEFFLCVQLAKRLRHVPRDGPEAFLQNGQSFHAFHGIRGFMDFMKSMECIPWWEGETMKRSSGERGYSRSGALI
jgi:hypothetical protein